MNRISGAAVVRKPLAQRIDSLGMPSRYYFNLTNSEATIRDEDGLEISNIETAIVRAKEAIAELRTEDVLASAEWRGWRLEIVDERGRVVHAIPLEQHEPLSSIH